MITDERDLARSLRTVGTPPGLTLDPDEVVGRARHTDRRRTTRKGALAAGSVAAVAATALWATGTALGPIAVLPAAPWTDACGGIVDGPSGTTINLDNASYAELPLAGSAASTAMVAFDACGGVDGRIAYATRSADGQLGDVERWSELDEATLQVLRNGQAVIPQPVPTVNGEVLYGVVASHVSDVRVLGNGGAVAVQRESLADTGLDAYASQEFTDPEWETIGMTWNDGLGVSVVWSQVLDFADFDDPSGVAAPLIAQTRDEHWQIWFGTEHQSIEGDLGSWQAFGFLEGEGRQVVAYLPPGSEIEVSAPDGGNAVGAEIRYAEPEFADGRFAWVSAPRGSKITWIATDGTREDWEQGATQDPATRD